MKSNGIVWIVTWTLFVILLSGCDELGTGGSIGLGVIGVIAGAIVIGWFIIKVLVGVLKVGFWGIILFVLAILGLIAYFVLQWTGNL